MMNVGTRTGSSGLCTLLSKKEARSASLAWVHLLVPVPNLGWVNGRHGSIRTLFGKNKAAKRSLPMTPRVRPIPSTIILSALLYAYSAL